MKKAKLFLLIFILFLIMGVSPIKVSSATREVIYFKENTCLVCSDLEDSGYIQKMIDQGINVTVMDIQNFDNHIEDLSYTDFTGEYQKVYAADVFIAYNDEYGRGVQSGVPVIFVGDTYFEDPDIKDAIDDYIIYDLSINPLKEVTVVAGTAVDKILGFTGFFIVLGAGLLDGFNPCAIALLLMFISILMGAKDKKVLLAVSTTYISALFVSYLLIGVFLLDVLNRYATQIAILGNVISWIIIVICLFLFALNVNDYIQSKNKKYKNIKHQLPKFIKRFNKKIVKLYSELVNPEEKSRSLLFVMIITFVLGIVLSITELICTGGIYGAILLMLNVVNSNYAYVLLVVYNLMFVVPLIVISVIAIRLKSVVTISNWIREHLSTIKILGAIFFLGTAIFFILRIFLLEV